MHEVGIAKNILETIEQNLPPENTRPVKSIHLKLGAKAGVSADALRFGFQIAGAESPIGSAELLIDEVPLRVECGACGGISNDFHPLMTCDVCGNASLKIVSGQELELLDFELA